MTVESESPRPTARNLPALLALAHALASIVFLSWRFGGMEPIGRAAAGYLGLLAPAVTVFAWWRADAPLRRAFLRIAVPLGGIALLVGISVLNPHMTLLMGDGLPSGLMDRSDYIRYLPSTAWPEHTLHNFLRNAGLVLIGLNVFLARPSRAQLRFTLGAIAGNATLLACVGSAFKLMGAKAIFGAYPSPNTNFFGSFFYYNHWGAFALLGAAAAGALGLHHWHNRRDTFWQHTPAPLLAVIALLILVTLPLSGARASSAAGLLLFLVFALRIVPQRGSRRSRLRLTLISAAIAVVVAGAGTYWVAKERVQFFAAKTSTQLSEIRMGGFGDARFYVYKETWNLFQDRPVFGWGWHSFRYMFRRVQEPAFYQQSEQRVKSVFLDAHNDWLQLLAELGSTGALLSLATFVGIARASSRRWWMLAPSFEIAAGLACLGLLACVDFPFACPAVVVTAWTLLAVAIGIARSRQAEAKTT